MRNNFCLEIQIFSNRYPKQAEFSLSCDTPGMQLNRFLFKMAFLISFSLSAMATDEVRDGAKDSQGQLLYSSYRILIPTLYYIPILNLDSTYQCTDKDKKIVVYSTEQKPIQTLCGKDYYNCMMQGSCILISGGKKAMINYRTRHKNLGLFSYMDLSDCPYGRGPKSVCLEPFYTVAADLTQHHVGDVIYVHEIKGTRLPNGDTHDGFLVVRDTGGRIKGQDRFDFFTGFYHHLDYYNPFRKLGLQEKKNQFRYLKITSSELRNKILLRRKYPMIAAEF